MKITSIEWMTKTKAKIYLNDEFAYVLTSSELKELHLSEGDDIADDFNDRILNEYVLRRAKQKALDLLIGKDYTEYELRMKLKRDMYPTALIQSAVDYIKSYHYIDDGRYARNYLTYHSHGQSIQVIRQKLKQKGISSQIIAECLEDTEINEKSKIEKIVRSKYGTKIIEDELIRQKALAFLLRKGYRYSDIQSVFYEIEHSDL